MNRPLIAFVLALTAIAAQAEARAPVGLPMPRDPVQADPLGPRSDPTVTVAAAVARTQAEKSGYTSVRGLTRTADGTWRAVARNGSNAPVAIAIDNQGKVTEAR